MHHSSVKSSEEIHEILQSLMDIIIDEAKHCLTAQQLCS